MQRPGMIGNEVRGHGCGFVGQAKFRRFDSRKMHPNLGFLSSPVQDHSAPSNKLTWAVLIYRLHPRQAMIVYCQSRKGTEELASELRKSNVRGMPWTFLCFYIKIFLLTL
jgi:hypothetical protein